jgi:hypothetical protein
MDSPSFSNWVANFYPCAGSHHRHASGIAGGATQSVPRAHVMNRRRQRRTIGMNLEEAGWKFVRALHRG